MQNAKVKVGDRYIGSNQPVYIIAEIGINHNGSLDNAKKLIDGAVFSGADCVKFQKRTPELCVPKDQWEIERDTPWGRMTYIDYRHKVEFTREDYAAIDAYCRQRKIHWTASPWDEEAVDFLLDFDVPFLKAASASLTDLKLLNTMKDTGKPLMISTGMSTHDEIVTAVEAVGRENLMMAHSTSTYPCPPEELNLRMIRTLINQYPDIPIGYSGHETGLTPTWGAVALGACFVERHITLDRAMWGSDQAASVEIMGFHKLVSNIRDMQGALGDGIKRVYASEHGPRQKLRRVASAQTA